MPGAATGSHPSASSSTAPKNPATMCHRYSVMTTALMPTTAAQARGRASQRSAGPETSTTRPTCTAASATSTSEGGDEFWICAPGTDTMLTGYGPGTVSSTSAVNAPATSTQARFTVSPSVPSCHANPAWWMPIHAKTKFPAAVYSMPVANRSTSPRTTPASATHSTRSPNRRCSRNMTGVSRTTAR